MERQDYINSVNERRGTAFPYLVLNVIDDNCAPHNLGFRVMHWHEDLQFIYVLSGAVEVVTLETRTPLHKGEGIFINKNVVHLVRKDGSCHYNSFIFPDYFLKFYPGSPAGDPVAQLVESQTLPLVPIKDRAENRAVLRALKKLSALEGEKSPLYPYEVLTALCSLWLELCRTVTPAQRAPLKNTVSARMTLFLRYIEQHYSEPISLENLAQSAHVSKSECLRCFKASLQMAPYQYLMEYRLSKAAQLLRSTDLPVGEIAGRVGFSQASHFGKCFREKTGLAPGAYRKGQQQGNGQ